MENLLSNIIKDPLMNDIFLRELDKTKEKEIYARISVLTWEEKPVEFIEAKIVSGSINIDGTSSIRRICNLSLIADELNINEYYWGLNSKFKLEIGIKNKLDTNYPDIIWFPQGLFIFTSFSTSISTGNYSINLSGKDKMCLLNGEVDGSLPHSVDFGTLELKDENGEIIFQPNTIREIIKNAVHVYGNEPLHNIIINDLEDFGVELLEYQSETPMFLLKNDFGYVNMTMHGDMPCYIYDNKNKKWINYHSDEDNTLITFSNLEGFGDYTSGYTYDKLIDFVQTGKNFQNGTKIKLSETSNKEFTIAKIEYGQTVGYRVTELTYAGDLIANIGEPLTSVLDKIKNMLGDFEYFYDIEGHFVFQRTKTYYSNPWNPIVDNENNENDIYVESAAHTSALAYTFHNSNFFTAISNNPQLLNIKNDFSVWGARKGITGAEIPIHMRYAFQEKPHKYIGYNKRCSYLDCLLDWEKDVDYDSTIPYEFVDWREIIYQMAWDYYHNNAKDDFYDNIWANNPQYLNGYTGYERYYTDMLGFWRDIYELPIVEEIAPLKEYNYYIKEDGKYIKQIFINEKTGMLIQDNNQIAKIRKIDKEQKYYIIGTTGNFEDAIFKNDTFIDGIDYYIKIEENNQIKYNKINIYDFINKKQQYYYYLNQQNFTEQHWNKNVYDDPSLLNFWIDFIGDNSDLEKYSIAAIGSRSKVIQDNQISGIYFKKTPTVVFVTPEEWEAMGNQPVSTGYIYIRIPNSMANFFKMSSQGKSANDAMDELIYQYTYAAETINLTTVPIYYLQPNTRISIQDKESGINGEYIISRISIPLNYNGMMQITASKAVESIY